MKVHKIKIIFVVIHAGIGGIEKAFVNLINELIKTNRFEIDIYMFTHKGELLDDFPDNVKFYPQNDTLKVIGITQAEAWQEGVLIGIKRLVLGGINRYISQELGYRIAMSRVKKIEGYDVAISFLQTKTASLYGGANEFVINKICAKKYCTFIHADLEKYNMITNYNHKMYTKFDKVASVSKSCEDLFIRTWPDLAKKACTVENCCNIDEICKLANQDIEYKSATVCFTTVARFGPEKGIIRAINIFAKMKKYSDLYVWHIIGSGVEESRARELIKKEGLENNIILHGEKKNPYSYIKNADALLIPSYREAAPVVIQEAYALGIPVLSTETRSAKEMIENTNIGIVCKNTDEAIYQMILRILQNPSEIMDIKKNMHRKENNNRQIEQFFDMICR